MIKTGKRLSMTPAQVAEAMKYATVVVTHAAVDGEPTWRRFTVLDCVQKDERDWWLSFKETTETSAFGAVHSLAVDVTAFPVVVEVHMDRNDQAVAHVKGHARWGRLVSTRVGSRPRISVEAEVEAGMVEVTRAARTWPDAGRRLARYFGFNGEVKVEVVPSDG